MSLSVGIVGFPNAGKSTLFNSLLGRQVASTAAYAFCTIEPNVGVVSVSDERLNVLADVIEKDPSTSLRTNRCPIIVPASVRFVDIAGLVKGAHKGEGLGNKFLAHIREVDVICFVLRAFEDKSVDLVGSSNPRKDLENLKSELLLKDLETIEKTSRLKLKTISLKEKQEREKIISKIVGGINKGLMVKDIVDQKEEKEFIAPLQLLTAKSYFVVLNVNEKDLLDIEKAISNYQDWVVIPICAKIEEELASLTANEQKEYLKSLNLEKSGLERLIKTAYDFLGLISFLTAGPKEVRAWTLRRGETALRASAVIHTDFAKQFIKVKVVSYEDFVKFGGWQKTAEKGKVRLEGRDYKIKDGEVVDFVVGK